MPDVTPEAQAIQKPSAIRADIAKMVGLDPGKATEIAKQRDQEAEVVRICKNNASETYNRLKEGEEVDVINLGIGKFDLSPTDNIRDLLTNFKKRIDEIDPKPPQEQIDIWSNQIGESALGDKQFAIAVNWYSYITHDRLGDIENASYIGKMASFAITPDEKYDLYLALQQVLPQEQAPQEAPQVPIVPEITQPSTAAAPVSAESIVTDEAAWQAAAGISPATSEPKTPITAPLQPDASILSYTPQAKAEPEQKPEIPTPIVIPTTETVPTPARSEFQPTPISINSRATEQPLPPVTPITIESKTTSPFQAPIQPTATATDPNLRPAPRTIEEARAQGFIDDTPPKIPTGSPPISSSEAELARAA